MTPVAARAEQPAARAAQPVPPALPAWVHAQSVNVTRHAAALRPFERTEFANGAATPSGSLLRVGFKQP